jgi:hypothetical protein
MSFKTGAYSKIRIGQKLIFGNNSSAFCTALPAGLAEYGFELSGRGPAI